MNGYLGVLRNPRAARPFAAAVLARLPISMAPLGLVLLVRELRDSYPLAGVVAGAFAVGIAVGSPVWGRALDRFGQSRVVAATSGVSGATLLALTLATASPLPGWVLAVLAAVVGLSFPPIGPAMREAWRVAFDDEGSRRLGYALDASAVETLFVTGPLLLTLLLAVSSPVVPLIVTAAILTGGGLLYSRTDIARSWRPRPAVGVQPEIARPVAFAAGIPSTLVVLTAMSIGFGLLDVSMAGLAEEVFGTADKLGFLFAGLAGGSAIGGLLYGRRTWRMAERRRLPVTLAAFGTMLVVLTVAAAGYPSMWLLVPVLFVTGLFIAPNIIVLQSLVDSLAPAHRLGEAQSWLSTAFTAGGALGNALAGILIDAGGARTALAVASAAVITSAAIAVLAQPRWRATLRPVPAGER